MKADDMTLADVLHVLGHTYKRGPNQKNIVMTDGIEVFRGDCVQAWAWLRGESRINMFEGNA